MDQAKILDDVRALIKECLIPRIDKLEAEVHNMRQVYWPVCAFFSETGPMQNIHDKSVLMLACEKDEIRRLVAKKNVLAKRLTPTESWRMDRVEEEVYAISETVKKLLA